jgi:hypothetical protein
MLSANAKSRADEVRRWKYHRKHVSQESCCIDSATPILFTLTELTDIQTLSSNNQ